MATLLYKFFLTFLLIFLTTSLNSFADTVNMYNGTVLKGKVERLTSNIIDMNTSEGHRKFTRLQVVNNRDFVEVGFRKKRIIAGRIFFMTPWVVHMSTPEGILQFSRLKVRNIVLGHNLQPEEDLQIQLPTPMEKSIKDSSSINSMPSNE